MGNLKVTVEAPEGLAPGTYVLESSAPPNPHPPDPPIPPNPNPTPPGTTVIPWGKSDSWKFQMPCEAVEVFVLDVPLDAVPGPYPNPFSFYEYQGPPTTRLMVLSLTPGDFGSPIVQSSGTSVTISVQVGWNVTPGGRYYLNVMNWDMDGNKYSCSVGSVLGSKAEWTFYP